MKDMVEFEMRLEEWKVDNCMALQVFESRVLLWR